MSFLCGVVVRRGRGRHYWGVGVLTGGWGVGCSAESKVLSRATPGLFKKTSPSTFFTMLTFSQILNIYLQWMTALSPAIVCKVKSDLPMYGKSSCQYNHDMAPSCTLIIPYRLSIMAQFSCQSQHIIWKEVSDGWLAWRRKIQIQASFVS